MNLRNVSFVIPTKNEQETIGEIIRDIRKICHKSNISIREIIITDDSTDKTREIANDNGATIVIGGGKGLGTAMLKGLKYAIKASPDIVISIDGDGQVDLSEIPLFIESMVHQRADMVLGSRFKEKEKALVHYRYPFINRIGIFILSFILKRLTTLSLTDSHGGIRAMNPHVVNELELIGTHTYVQESIIDAHENGFKIIEIPSRWLKRSHGGSRVVSSIPEYVFSTLPVLILRSGKHVGCLFYAGIFLILLAFIHISIVLIQTNFFLPLILERQSLVLFFVLLSFGVNLFLFGVTLELLAQIKKKE